MGLIRFIKNKINNIKKIHMIPIYGTRPHACKSIPSLNIYEQLINEAEYRYFQCWIRKLENEKNMENF